MDLLPRFVPYNDLYDIRQNFAILNLQFKPKNGPSETAKLDK
jgi:hypothetical protein